jgi:Putative Se/S carrier protein-like
MLFLFQSTHDVILAERAIRSRKIPCRVIPVPRSVSSQCGMALDIPKEYAEDTAELLNTSVLPSDNAKGKRFTTYTPKDEE